MKPLLRALLTVMMLVCGLAHIGVGGTVIACGQVASDVGGIFAPEPDPDSGLQERGPFGGLGKAGGTAAKEASASFEWFGRALLLLGFLQILACWGIARRAWPVVLGVAIVTLCADLGLIIMDDWPWAGGVVTAALAIWAVVIDRRQPATPVG